jgi:hypothetical protein
MSHSTCNVSYDWFHLYVCLQVFAFDHCFWSVDERDAKFTSKRLLPSYVSMLQCRREL